MLSPIVVRKHPKRDGIFWRSIRYSRPVARRATPTLLGTSPSTPYTSRRALRTPANLYP